MSAGRMHECWSPGVRWALLALALAPAAALAGSAAPADSSTAAGSSAHAPDGCWDLPRLMWDDAKRLVTSRQSLVIVGVGLAAAGAAHAADDEIAASDFVGGRNGDRTIDRFFDAGDPLGNGVLHIGGAVLGYGVGKVFSNREIEQLGRDLIRAQALNGPMTLALKAAVGRERPDGSSRRSFPSGHASASFATASVLHSRYGWKAGVPSYLVASYVSASRINDAKHYLSDVVFGATLGILAGRTVTADIRGERWSLRPVLHRGEPVVVLTWLGSPVDVPVGAGAR